LTKDPKEAKALEEATEWFNKALAARRQTKRKR
jgi:hypothetical protein